MKNKRIMFCGKTYSVFQIEQKSYCKLYLKRATPYIRRWRLCARALRSMTHNTHIYSYEALRVHNKWDDDKKRWQ